MTADGTASEWRDIADQLTPEQIVEMEEIETRGVGETAYLLINAREYAQDNVRSAVMFPEVERPPDATGALYPWGEYPDGWRRDFDGTSRTHGEFTITIAGRQYADGTAVRYARIVVYDGDEFTAEDVRRIAILMSEAGDELDELKGK